jgi:hypothetical protein
MDFHIKRNDSQESPCSLREDISAKTVKTNIRKTIIRTWRRVLQRTKKLVYKHQ